MGSSRKERRSKPRVRSGLAARLSSEFGSNAQAAETINLSTAGVCCRLPNCLELLTKVKITLLVPDARSTKQTRTAVVHTQGIVVRTEPTTTEQGSAAFEIACAFMELSNKDRKILQSYVDSQLAELPVSGTPTREETVGSQGAGIGTRD